MLRASRVKRASVQDLYRQCQLGGDCPPDVRPKVEGSTLADKLLQIFSSIVFFGNLGIGSGKGTGGQTGYRPLGSGAGRPIEGVTRPTGPVEVLRPSLPVDPLGGVESIPLDVLDTSTSSIVPLLEGDVPEIYFVPPPSGPGPAEIDVTDITQVVSSPEQPTIITATGGRNTVVDFQPGPPPAKRIVLSVGEGPRSSIQVHAPPDNELNIFVDPAATGNVVDWGEEIPLVALGESVDSGLTEGPLTSTPIDPTTSRLSRVATRARDLYNRFVQQVPTRNIDFLGAPSRAIEFGFENPAYDPDISMIFERDLAQISATPDPDFTDVRRLGHARFSETPEGTVRVSRLAQRAQMRTRSGLHVGQRVHFYYDISDIPVPDPSSSIELQPLGSFSGDQTVVDAQLESSFVTGSEGPAAPPDTPINISSTLDDSERALLDVYSEEFNNSQLILSFTTEEGHTLDMPTIPPGLGFKAYVPDIGQGFIVSYPVVSQPPRIVLPVEPFSNLEPSNVFFGLNGESFVFDPSLFKRRKRKLDSI